MSHFTTLVIVNEAEDADAAIAVAEQILEPFNENLEVTPYFEPVDDLETALEYHRKDHPEPERNSPAWREWVAQAIEDWTGRRGFFHNGAGHWGYMTTYNPNSKWDWYSVGGRWTGFFPLKDGANGKLGRPGVFGNEAEPGTADVARKDEIDFDYLRRQKVLNAELEYTAFEQLVASVEETDEFITWKQARQRAGDDIAAARAIYGTQPVVAAMRKDTQTYGFSTPEDFFYRAGGRERYVRNALLNAVSTYAVVDSEGWHERGSMGWFGVSTNEMDTDVWGEQFNQMLDNLPDTTWLVLFDLHI